MDDLLTYLHGHKETRSLFGLTMDDITISQTRGDYLFLDYVLARHKTISRVVELGTFRGLTSLYLGICMALRGGDVQTIDLPRVGQIDNKIVGLWPGNVHRHEFDVLRQVDEVVSLLTDQTMLICDNGDKFDEARLYGPHIRGNSLLLIHDSNVEYDADKMREMILGFGLTELYRDIGDPMGSLYLVFAK